MSKAIQDVISERQRQQAKEGYSTEHDDNYIAGVLSLAGAAYAIAGSAMNGIGTYKQRAKNLWPFPLKTFKPTGSNDRRIYRKDLVKAAALIVAEIERIDRAIDKEPTK